jgi:hypothetical protein
MAFWEASIYADEQMSKDEHWAESGEGKFLLGLLKHENDRLRQRTVDCLRCGEKISYQQGTCPHCGYVEFK